MFERKMISTKQGEFIRSYNLLVDAMNKLGMKTTLAKFNTDGVCNGLSYGYKLYAHQGRREEYVSALIQLASIKSEEQFIRLLERKTEKAFFELSLSEKRNLVLLNQIIPILEIIQLGQQHKSLTEIGVMWDKTYSFVCHESQLVQHLKNVSWKEGESAFVNLGFHVFYIERCRAGFYLFESNAINQGAIQPGITSEDVLAFTILQNIKPFINMNGYIAFSMQFISYASQSTSNPFDDALLKIKNELDPYPSLKMLCADYQQKKLSRLDCAIAIKYITAREKINSDQLSPFFNSVEKYVNSERRFTHYCIQYHSNTINNTAYNSNISLLYLAVSYGQMYFIKKLLRDKTINGNHATTKGSTALIIAADIGITAVFSSLLKHSQIDVNQADNKRITSLYLAAQNGHAPIVALLCKHPKIKINHANNNGVTALYIAAQNGHMSVVEILLTHSDINVNQTNVHGTSPLAIAIYKGHAAIAALLIARGAVQDQSTAMTPSTVWQKSAAQEKTAPRLPLA